MASIAQSFGFLSDEKKYSPSNRWVLNKCKIGLEVEVEGVDPTGFPQWFQSSSLWKSKQDNSLQDQGLEFVTEPLFGEDLLDALEEFKSLQTSAGMKNAKITHRCGFHVHIDVRNLSEQELLTMLMLVAMVEEFLYEYCDETRSNSVFCLPFSKISVYAAGVSRILYDFNGNRNPKNLGNEIKQLFNEERRYGGTNISALAKFGTLEFRQHPGTMDTERMYEWVNIIMCIKKFSKNSSPKSLPGYVSEHTTIGFLTEVFGQYANSFINMKDIDGKLRRGIAVAQTIGLIGPIESETAIDFLKFIEAEFDKAFPAIVDKWLMPTTSGVQRDLLEQWKKDVIGGRIAQKKSAPKKMGPKYTLSGGASDTFSANYFSVGNPVGPTGTNT